VTCGPSCLCWSRRCGPFVDTEEVTGSNPVSPTSSEGISHRRICPPCVSECLQLRRRSNRPEWGRADMGRSRRKTGRAWRPRRPTSANHGRPRRSRAPAAGLVVVVAPVTVVAPVVARPDPDPSPPRMRGNRWPDHGMAVAGLWMAALFGCCQSLTGAASVVLALQQSQPAPTASAPSTSVPAQPGSVTAPIAAHPAGSTARCGDGTYSFNAHRTGTCSHHGGVAEWFATV
jgi:hypothetical protein